jgi:glycosyltransferase involved in cell wall biosynthesis
MKNKINVTVISTMFPRFKNDAKAPFIYRSFKIVSEKYQNINFRILAPMGTVGNKKDLWGRLIIDRVHYWWPIKKQNLVYASSINTFERIKSNPLLIFKLFFYFFYFFLKVRKYWNVTNIFHCQWSISAIYPIILNYFTTNKKPIIVTVRGSDLRSLPGWFNRFIIRKTTVITYPSPEIAINRYNKKLGVNVANYIDKNSTIGLKTIYDPIGEYLFQDIDSNFKQSLGLLNHKIILWLGRMDNMKNPLLALKIAKDLAKIRSDFVLLMVGNGDLDLEIKNYVKKNNLSKSVKIMGVRADVQNFMNIADIFLSTATHNNVWSSTIAESMLLGCPLVLSDVDCTSEVFTNDFDSLIIPLNDRKMYIRKINQLIDDASMMSSLATNAKDTFQANRRHDSQASKDYYDLYFKILKMNKKE